MIAKPNNNVQIHDPEAIESIEATSKSGVGIPILYPYPLSV